MTEEAQPEEGKTEVEGPPAALPVVRKGAVLLDKNTSNQLWQVALKFSASTLVPKHYQGQPENCFISLQMATRMGVDPMMLMQNTYIVHGKPGFYGQFVSALVNASGLFIDDLQYEVQGDNPHKQNYRVRAFAERKSTGKVLHGPWIDWPMVKGEGWNKDKGDQKSKWNTLPELMFLYRAATFFARTQCSQVLMGMQTAEEIMDADFSATTTPAARGEALIDRLKGKEPAPLAIDGTPPPVSDKAPPEKCPHCDGPIIGGETDKCPHCKKPLQEGEKTVGESDAETKAGQKKLWTLLEKLTGDDPIQCEAVLHEVAGTVQLEKLHGTDLGLAIKAVEERLKEKGGKAKQGELL